MTTNKKWTSLTLALLLSTACISQQKDLNLTAINLSVDYPMVKEDFNVYHFTDTISIYYYGNSILYRLFESRQLETDIKIPGTETYFIFRKGSDHGLYFSPKNYDSSQRLPVDSFLHKRAFWGMNVDIDTSALILSSNTKNGNILEQKYATKKRSDDNSPDSLFFSFSKDLNDVDYSFSKKLDSARQMKLFKFMIHFNEHMSTKYNRTMPERKCRFEIQRIEVPNKTEILTYFKHYEGKLP